MVSQLTLMMLNFNELIAPLQLINKRTTSFFLFVLVVSLAKCCLDTAALKTKLAAGPNFLVALSQREAARGAGSKSWQM